MSEQPPWSDPDLHPRDVFDDVPEGGPRQGAHRPREAAAPKTPGSLKAMVIVGSLGLLLGAFGVGAVGGALFVGRLRAKYETETVVRVSTLAFAVGAARTAVEAALETEDFAAAMTALAALRAPVDAFFEAVMVNSDIAAERENRLKLLGQVRDVMGKVADFGQIAC